MGRDVVVNTTFQTTSIISANIWIMIWIRSRFESPGCCISSFAVVSFSLVCFDRWWISLWLYYFCRTSRTVSSLCMFDSGETPCWWRRLSDCEVCPSLVCRCCSRFILLSSSSSFLLRRCSVSHSLGRSSSWSLSGTGVECVLLVIFIHSCYSSSMIAIMVVSSWDSRLDYSFVFR